MSCESSFFFTRLLCFLLGGYFYAALKRKSAKILLLHKGDLELPSDISGIIYIDITNGIEAAGGQIERELDIVPK